MVSHISNHIVMVPTGHQIPHCVTMVTIRYNLVHVTMTTIRYHIPHHVTVDSLYQIKQHLNTSIIHGKNYLQTIYMAFGSVGTNGTTMPKFAGFLINPADKT